MKTNSCLQTRPLKTPALIGLCCKSSAFHSSVELLWVLRMWSAGNPLGPDLMGEADPSLLSWMSLLSAADSQAQSDSCWGSPWELRAALTLNPSAFCCTRSSNNSVFTLAQSISLVMERRDPIMWCFSAPYKFYIPSCMYVTNFSPQLVYPI